MIIDNLTNRYNKRIQLFTFAFCDTIDIYKIKDILLVWFCDNNRIEN